MVNAKELDTLPYSRALQSARHARGRWEVAAEISRYGKCRAKKNSSLFDCVSILRDGLLGWAVRGQNSLDSLLRAGR